MLRECLGNFFLRRFGWVYIIDFIEYNYRVYIDYWVYIDFIGCEINVKIFFFKELRFAVVDLVKDLVVRYVVYIVSF